MARYEHQLIHKAALDSTVHFHGHNVRTLA